MRVSNSAVSSVVVLDKCQVTSTSLQISEGLQWDDAVKIGRGLSAAIEWSSWAIGDFLIYVGQTYSDTRYQFAEELFGVSRQTLKNVKTVCRVFPPSRRRDAPLRFTHHAEVASLPIKEQNRLLDLAVKDGLSCVDLREMVRDKTEGKPEETVKIHEPMLTAHTTPLCMFCSAELELMKRDPERWPDDKRGWWKRELKPIVEFYGQL